MNRLIRKENLIKLMYHLINVFFKFPRAYSGKYNVPINILL